MSIDARAQIIIRFGSTIRGMVGDPENNMPAGEELQDNPDTPEDESIPPGEEAGGGDGGDGGSGGGGDGGSGGGGGGGAGGGTEEPDAPFQSCKSKYGVSDDEAQANDMEGSAHPFGTSPEGLARERAWREGLGTEGDAAGMVDPNNANAPPPAECKAIPADAPDSTRLSKYFTIGSLSSHVVDYPHKLRPNMGLSKAQIACNLRHLAVNALDPILDHFKARGWTVKVTSGFRPYSGKSDHNVGSAADLAFYHPNIKGGRATGQQLARVMKAINEVLRVPYTQMIFEADRIIHIACRRSGQNSGVRMFWSPDFGNTRGGQNYRYNVSLDGTPPVK